MVFFSTFLYTLAKREGPNFRAAVVREVELGPRSSIPALRTAALLSNVEDVATSVSGACLIGPARSMQAGLFLASGCDVWVTCDDDESVGDPSALANLVAACRATRQLVSIPSLQRDAGQARFTPDKPGYINVRLVEDDKPELMQGDGYTLARVRRTGMGLCAMHFDLVDHLKALHPELEVIDDETGRSFPGLFYEMLRDKHWLGEDNSFCERVRKAGHEMWALLDVESEHAGRRVRVELDAEGQLAMRVWDLKERT